MLKKNIIIGVLIASSALNLTAYNDNIKVTKADVASDSVNGFLAAGLTTTVAKILIGSMDEGRCQSYAPRLNSNLGTAVDVVMVGTLLAAIARDAQRKSIYDTEAFAGGVGLGIGTCALPQITAMLGGAYGLVGGALGGGALGVCADAAGICKMDACMDFGAKAGMVLGGVSAGAIGVGLSAGIVGAALYRNASDLHKLTKPQDL